MTSYTVHVSNLSPATTEQHLHDFFTFCGKIHSVEFDPATHSATINFEKPQAAKTALMLNGGTLDGSHISVTSDTVHLETEEKPEGEGEAYRQEYKPKAGIFAEILAKGYKLSDQILHRAIDYDSQQGISTRFLAYFHSLDTKLGEKALGPEKTISGKLQESLAEAQARAKAIDEEKGLSKQAADYYTKALSSPFGQKVKQFYTTTSKQVLDIHEEALRIANLHPKPAEEAPTGAAAAPGSAGAGITGGPDVAGVEKGKGTEAPTVF
ncbi:unnamed protein product [Somion occarium]|uniref:RRM domain-containing protein n=2 Tax=Somion occarium TaxID=3059160 RepID=A0ABP1E091_9APHY